MNRLPWHQRLWQNIEAYEQSNTLPHALLLLGGQGLGKRDFALALANRRLCANSNTDSCGQCSSCLNVKAGSHPDLIQVSAEEGKSYIGVDAVRDLQQQLSQTSHGGRGFVIIVCLAEAMNRAASNALLKSLEEPPGDALFLLIAESTETIPQTIISRCQTLAFRQVDSNTLENYLVENQHPTEHAFLLQGSPLLAEERLSDAYLSARQSFYQALTKVAEAKLCPIEFTTTWLKEDSQLLLMWLFNWLSDALKLLFCPTTTELLNKDCRKLLVAYIKSRRAAQIFTILDELMTIKKALDTQANINKGLWFENLFINVCRQA